MVAFRLLGHTLCLCSEQQERCVMAVDRKWEEKFDSDQFDDYKMAWVEKERLRQENSDAGWIYIGMDTRSRDRAKIGLTTGRLATRASSSHNPSYVPYYAFKVKEGVCSKQINKIEALAISMLETKYERVPHEGSGVASEWFMVSPDELKEEINEFLCERHMGSMLGYRCSDRDMDVIHSWGNDRILNGGGNMPYEASDRSNPPVAFECYMPGGCGAADCDCFE